jgi:hypothetical protein
VVVVVAAFYRNSIEHANVNSTYLLGILVVCILLRLLWLASLLLISTPSSLRRPKQHNWHVQIGNNIDTPGAFRFLILLFVWINLYSSSSSSSSPLAKKRSWILLL